MNARRLILALVPPCLMLVPPCLMLLPLCLAGCGEQPRDNPSDRDPMMTEALEGQLMVDPDLTQQNMHNLAAIPAGPPDGALPLPDPEQERKQAQ